MPGALRGRLRGRPGTVGRVQPLTRRRCSLGTQRSYRIVCVEAAFLFVALCGVIFASWAWLEARKARVASERSATAAERSAATSSDALALQRQEADAARDERTRRLRADVVPIKWESQGQSGTRPHVGLVVTNRGPGVARDVRGECLVTDLYRAGETASLMTGQTVGFREELRDFRPVPDEVGELPARGDGEYVARAFWTDEDGTRRSTEWVRIPRY